MKIDWILYRTEQNEKGTVSHNLVMNENRGYQHICCNLELPYRSNCRNVSCIPAGIYPFEKRNHQIKGHVVRILNVPDRSGIMAHVGNYLEDTEGCILPCSSLKINSNGLQYVGIDSKVALDKLWESLPVSGLLHIVSQA